MELKNYLLEEVKRRLQNLKTEYIIYSFLCLENYEAIISFRESQIEELKSKNVYEESYLDKIDYLLNKENFEHFLKNNICEMEILVEMVSAKINNFDIENYGGSAEATARNFKQLYDFIAFNTCYSIETNSADEFAQIASMCNEFEEITRLLNLSYIN